MAEFTKGPWRCVIARWTPDSPIGGFTIYADAVRKAPDGSEVGLANGGTTSGQWAFSAFFSPKEIEANGHLISAAPEMYEALKAVTEHLHVLSAGEKDDPSVGISGWAACHEAIAKAIAALAKAESR